MLLAQQQIVAVFSHFVVRQPFVPHNNNLPILNCHFWFAISMLLPKRLLDSIQVKDYN